MSSASAPRPGEGPTIAGVSAHALSVLWTKADDDGTPPSKLEYKVVSAPSVDALDEIDEADAIDAPPALVMDWTADVTTTNASGLAAQTPYWFTVLVRDEGGDRSLYAPSAVRTTDAPDLTPPTAATGIAFTAVTNTSAVVSWRSGADELTPAESLAYKVVRAASREALDTLGEADGPDVTKVRDWGTGLLEAPLTGLSRNSTVWVAVLVRDAAGNRALAAPSAVQTADIDDRSPPVLGGAARAFDVEALRLRLAWTEAKDDLTPADRIEYRVVRAGSAAELDTPDEALAIDGSGVVLPWQAQVTAVLATGLSEATRYAFAVLARDEAGNVALAPPLELDTPTRPEYPHSLRLGVNRPAAGPFAAVDQNGDAPGLGWETATWGQGARYNGEDLEIGVYSENATAILVEFYGREHVWAADRVAGLPEPRDGAGHAVYDTWLVKGPDGVWRAKFSQVRRHERAGVIYGFRAFGPNWPYVPAWRRGNSAEGFIADVDPTNGHRFNPNKLLTDPYGLELTHDTEYPALVAGGENVRMYATGGANSKTWEGAPMPSLYKGGVLSTGGATVDRRIVDTGRFAPKTFAIAPPRYEGPRPNVPENDVVAYEAHLKGLTKHPSSSRLKDILAGFEGFADVLNVPPEYRGTYRGAAYLAKYFKALGITAVELLPIHEVRNDLNDLYDGDPSIVLNFWGYGNYSYFAPDRHYAYDKSPGGPTREFQAMVTAFAEAGVEIWLDVVYNNAGEGGIWVENDQAGPDIIGFGNLGGFDVANRYLLNPFDRRRLNDRATMVGNQLNFSKAANRRLVLDSLSYWIDVMGAGGFRFDLAPVLGRDPDAHERKGNYDAPGGYWHDVRTFETRSPLLRDIADLGAARKVKMVAEPWDIWGGNTGRFPNGWGEWNDRYRDTTRKFLRGDASGKDGLDVSSAFHGDFANFNDQGGPQKSVNFIVAHDGFTLADLVSYNGKTNGTRQWPFGPSVGGADENLAWDSTGSAKPPHLTVEQFRRQRLRNFWVWQFFGRGTPMIVWGDELGRTQNGNNNTYNVDSPATWTNYEMIASDAPQTVPVQGLGPQALPTDRWLEPAYRDSLGTDTRGDSKNSLFLFANHVMRLRQAEPALRQSSYAVGIDYTSEDGGPLNSWGLARRIHIRGASVAGGSDYVLLVNMWREPVSFKAPAPPPGKTWRRIIDTAHWAEGQGDNAWSDASAWTWSGDPYGVNAWSIVVFKAL